MIAICSLPAHIQKNRLCGDAGNFYPLPSSPTEKSLSLSKGIHSPMAYGMSDHSLADQKRKICEYEKFATLWFP